MTSRKQLPCHTNDIACHSYGVKSHPNWAVQHCSRRQYVWSGWLTALACSTWIFWIMIFMHNFSWVNHCQSDHTFWRKVSCQINWPIGTVNFTLEDNNYYDRPVITITVENVFKVKLLIKKDPKITHEEIKGALGIHQEVWTTFYMITSASCNIAPFGSLALLNSRKRGRVTGCIRMLKKLVRGPCGHVWDIVTGDKM